MSTKRKNDQIVVADNVKRIKNDSQTIAKSNGNQVPAVARISDLYAPTMLLEGHESDVYSVKFHPDGNFIISAGYDRKIFVWTVYGECENISIIGGHTGAVMEMNFTPDGNQIYTASTDRTLGLWDFMSGQRLKKFKGHKSYVNCVKGTRQLPLQLVSGSDDNTIKLWDCRKRHAVTTLNNNYQVTGVAYNLDSSQVFSAGIDEQIKVWDLRKNDTLFTLDGHQDTITDLQLSPDGSYLLSNSMDNSLRVWDIRSYSLAERCVKVFTGHQHNFERNLLRCAWSPNGMRISAGSADRCVNIWDTTSRNITYKLPGHKGSVNDVAFHPEDKIIISASSDKTLYMGEVEF